MPQKTFKFIYNNKPPTLLTMALIITLLCINISDCSKVQKNLSQNMKNTQALAQTKTTSKTPSQIKPVSDHLNLAQVGSTVSSQSATYDKSFLMEVKSSKFDQFTKSLSQQSSDDTTASTSNFEKFIEQRPVLIFLLSILTVGICCLLSQCLVRFSKNYKLSLNKYYSKKKFEKAKMIQQFLNQEEQHEYEQVPQQEAENNRKQEEDLLEEDASPTKGGQQ